MVGHFVLFHRSFDLRWVWITIHKINFVKKMRQPFNLLSILILFILFSCSENASKDSDEKVKKDSIVCIIPPPDSYNVSVDEIPALDTLHRIWLKEKFYPLLSKFNLKQNCKVCGDIFVRLCIEIDSSGKAEKCSIEQTEADCRKEKPAFNEELEKSIPSLNSFSKIQFPEKYKRKKLKIIFGQTTKC